MLAEDQRLGLDRPVPAEGHARDLDRPVPVKGHARDLDRRRLDRTGSTPRAGPPGRFIITQLTPGDSMARRIDR